MIGYTQAAIWFCSCPERKKKVLDVVCVLRADKTERKFLTTLPRSGIAQTIVQCQLVV